MKHKKIHEYTVKFKRNDLGGWRVIVPALPEVQTEGMTMPEAEQRAQEAITLALRVRVEDGETIPRDVDYKAEAEPKFIKLQVAV